MEALEKFNLFVEKLKKTSSRLAKEDILYEYKDDEEVKNITAFIFDPYIVTGISKKKFEKEVSVSPDQELITIEDVITYLKNNNHGSDRDIANIQNFVNHNYTYKELIYSIVCKDLTVGISAITINKIWGNNFIKQFAVMLAEKYFDAPEKYLKQNTQFILTEKLDGVRCALLFDENKYPHFFSRNGKEITDLVELVEEAKNLDPEFVYDGELLYNAQGSSKDIYRSTVSVVTSDNIKSNILYNVFDKVLRKDFEQGYSAVPAYKRKQSIENELTTDKFTFIRKVPMLYMGENQDRIYEYLQWAKHNEKEGVMINIADAGYQCKRSRDLLKVKVFNECEAYVEKIEPGTGRNENRLGNIVVKFKHNNTWNSVKVGSGFSDKERDLYWEHPEYILNKVVEISYFELSNNKDNNDVSLRFPTWLGRIRDDKSIDTITCI